MCYIFVNILKIAVSEAFCHQTQRLLYFCAKISLYYSSIFVGGSARFDFVLWRRVPSLRYADTHTTGFWKLYNV